MSRRPNKPSLPDPAENTSDPAEEEYYVYPVLDGTDYRIHTPEHPFCEDLACPCHEDPELINELEGYRQDGLITAADADRIYRGQSLR